MIITISRQYGSGGTEIAAMISKKLGIPYYDKSIIDLTAKESGFDPEFIKRSETNVTSSLLYNLAVGSIYTQPLTDQLYAAECKVIRAIADNGPCVIVGRCADYILKDNHDLLRVFVRADSKDRIERITGRENCSENDAKDLIKKHDKSRSRHYKYYTDGTWGDCMNYDLCLNSSACDIEKAADIIISLYSK